MSTWTMKHLSSVGTRTDCVTNTCNLALSCIITNGPFVVKQMQHFRDVLFTVSLGTVIYLFCVVDLFSYDMGTSAGTGVPMTVKVSAQLVDWRYHCCLQSLHVFKKVGQISLVICSKKDQFNPKCWHMYDYNHK